MAPNGIKRPILYTLQSGSIMSAAMAAQIAQACKLQGVSAQLVVLEHTVRDTASNLDDLKESLVAAGEQVKKMGDGMHDYVEAGRRKKARERKFWKKGSKIYN